MSDKEGRKLFGRLVKKVRQDRCMTLKDLEETSGISKTTISKVENGAFNPGADTLYKLAEGLHAKWELTP